MVPKFLSRSSHWTISDRELGALADALAGANCLVLAKEPDRKDKANIP